MEKNRLKLIVTLSDILNVSLHLVSDFNLYLVTLTLDKMHLKKLVLELLYTHKREVSSLRDNLFSLLTVLS